MLPLVSGYFEKNHDKGTALKSFELGKRFFQMLALLYTGIWSVYWSKCSFDYLAICFYLVIFLLLMCFDTVQVEIKHEE